MLRPFMLALIVLPWGAASAQTVVEVPGGDRNLDPDLTDVYRVGSLAGETWETFANIRSVAFDAEGNLYILDAGSHRVVVVDEGGRLVREFGKEGDGPGELRSPLGMVVAPDGSTAILDLGHQAFALYDAEGNHVRNVRNPIQGGLLSTNIDYHPRSGAVGARTTTISVGGGPPPPPGTPIRLVPFAEGAEPEDLVTAWRPPAEESNETQTISGGANVRISFGGMSKLRAFEPPVRTAVLPDGRVAVADTSAYQLRLVAPEGGVDALLRRPGIAPRPVTDRMRTAERERRLAEIEEQAASGGSGGGGVVMRSSGGGDTRTMSIGGGELSEMQKKRLEDMIFADEVPVIVDIAADTEGRIWVERSGDRVGEDGPTDVITPDGRYLGTIAADGVRIPDAFGPGGLAAYIEKDEFDVEYVVVRRVSGVR